MAWFVVRHPETGGIGCVSDEALDLHLLRGWQLLSDALSEDARAQFNPADWAGQPAPDADEASTDEEPDDPAETEE